MSYTAAAGARQDGRRLLLPAAALLLCCLSLLLHGQLQVHSQLRAAHKELADIKYAVGATAYDGLITAAGTPASSSSSSSSSSRTGAVTLSPQQQQGQGSNTSLAAAAPGTLCLEMPEFLGLHQYLAGITWEPKACYTGLGQIYKDPQDQLGLRERLMEDLTATMASVRGVAPQQINISAPWWAGIVGEAPKPQKSILSDPGFNRWQAALVGLLSRYLVLADTKTPAVPCNGAPPAWAATAVAASELPLEKCEGRSDEELVALMGRHGQPFDPLTTIVNVIMNYGLCTVPDRGGFNSYGEFLLARTMTSKWHTFKTRSLEEDAVVFLWDILYQAREVFMKQRWLGVAAMQQPFDFLAIANIIYETQPDVILETGTANGGSALMWASMLELNGLTNSSVITVDIQKPGVAGAFGADPPAQVVTASGQVVVMPRKRPQQNPLDHPLWAKYVTFVEGSSIEPGTITQVKGLLQQKQHALWSLSRSGGGGSGRSGSGSSSDSDSGGASGGSDSSDSGSSTRAADADSEAAVAGDIVDAADADAAGMEESDAAPAGHADSSSSDGVSSISTSSNEVASSSSSDALGSSSSSSSAGRSRAGRHITAAAVQPPPPQQQLSQQQSSQQSSPQQQQPSQQQQQRPLRVMVLLDSHHAAAHVLTEMESFCPLVSPGSFCIVEDTKLSRWTNSDPGPLSSVQSFLSWHPEFAVDRDRELLFTHHPYGYLQRLY